MDPLSLYLRQNVTTTTFQIMEIRRSRTDSPIRKTVRQAILVKYLDPDSGLLDKLLGCGLLTWEEFDKIRTTGSQRSRNERLLNVILSRGVYQRFLSLLKETQHGHLVDYESDSDYYHRLLRGDIPLTSKEETVLDINREVVIELIKDSTQLAQQLFSVGVLNEAQMDRICSTLPSLQMCGILLDVLRRRSLKEFQATIRCLRAMQHSHVARILEGGVVARVTCRLKSGTEPIDADAIVSELLLELNDGAWIMERSEMSKLSLIGLGLIYVRRSNGIVLYFHFRSLDELQALRTKHESDFLRQIAEKEFVDLTRFPADKVKLTVDWPEYDYQRCVRYFSLVPSTTVNNLPLEVLDIILRKAVHFLKLHGSEKKESSYDDIFISLTQASYCWNQRLSNSILKKTISKTYKAYIQKVKKRSAILRNNRKYLVNVIQPNDLIHHLFQYGCLDEKQAMLLRGLRNDTVKNHELLNIARTFSLQSHFKFLDCLYMTNQQNAAKVVETGGATVKLCIENETSPNVPAIEKDLVGQLQTMLLKVNDEKLWPHKLFNSVNIYDVIILSVQQRREAIDLWLWCRSQNALERLKDSSESELLEIMEQLFNRFQLSASLKPRNAFIDSGYFNYETVVLRMSAKLRGNLLCPFDKTSLGIFRVSSLLDKVYVTTNRTTIHIYEDKVPYRQLGEKIHLPRSSLGNPLELVSCQVSKCLYIADPAQDCIWKLNPENNYELMKWLSEPFPKLSVCSDGMVLLLDTDETNPKLKLYTQDAELLSTINMRSNVYLYKSAAVELSPGVVAAQYEKMDPRGVSKGIAIMRLNETGDILRDVECKEHFNLAPYSAGRLIATDQGANKVMLLDDQMKPLQIILSTEENELEWPLSFSYRRDTRELIVIQYGYTYEFRGYQFKVYKLSYDEERST